MIHSNKFCFFDIDLWISLFDLLCFSRSLNTSNKVFHILDNNKLHGTLNFEHLSNHQSISIPFLENFLPHNFDGLLAQFLDDSSFTIEQLNTILSTYEESYFITDKVSILYYPMGYLSQSLSQNWFIRCSLQFISPKASHYSKLR